MKFAVTLPTYYRSDGTSFEKTSRAIKSVLQQTYTDWVIYLVGDHYISSQEFMQLVNLIPPHKVVYCNFPSAPERENLNLSSQEVWCIAGLQNVNSTLDKQRKDGIRITCRLDDDDCWLPNHLEVLKRGYDLFPESVLIYTRSEYCQHHLPILHKREVLFGDMPHLWENSTPLLKYNNFPPMPENIVHSSVSWDILRIPFNYFASSPKLLPGDAALWHKINQFAEKNMFKTLYIPVTTVSKFDEATSLS